MENASRSYSWFALNKSAKTNRSVKTNSLQLQLSSRYITQTRIYTWTATSYALFNATHNTTKVFCITADLGPTQLPICSIFGISLQFTTALTTDNALIIHAMSDFYSQLFLLAIFLLPTISRDSLLNMCTSLALSKLCALYSYTIFPQ